MFFMFDKLRRPGRSLKEGKAKKFFSYFLFGAICLIFVFLIPGGPKIAGEGVVAYVGNEPIRTREFRRMEEIVKQSYQSRLEQADDQSLLKIQEEIKQTTKIEIIRKYLLIQGAQKAGFFVSDKELRSEIRSFPSFQENGHFLYSRYLNFLKSQRLQPSRFEDRVRKDKMVQNWVNLFKKSIILNNVEREKKTQRHIYKVNFRYVLLNSFDIEEEILEPFVKAGNIQQIDRFLKKHKVSWEKTGVFSVVSGSNASITQNQNLMEVVISHLPHKGIIPKLIRQTEKLYIVDVLSFKKGNISPQDQQLESFLRRRFDKASRLLNSWIELQRQKVKIKLFDNI